MPSMWSQGTIYLSQTLKFRRPIGLSDTVSVMVRAIGKNDAKHHVTFDCKIINQHNQVVVDGIAEFIAPSEKICRERVELPEVELHQPSGPPDSSVDSKTK